MGGGYLPGTVPQALGAISVLLASVNVAGGFVITKRMLDMFRSQYLSLPVVHRFSISPICSPGPTDPPEYSYLYVIPGVVFAGGFLASASTGTEGLIQAGYLTSTLLCIGTSSVKLMGSTTHTRPSRVFVRPGLTSHSKTRQRIRNTGCKLWYPGVSRCRRLPARSASPIHCCRRRWRPRRDHPRAQNHCNGTAPDDRCSALRSRTRSCLD